MMTIGRSANGQAACASGLAACVVLVLLTGCPAQPAPPAATTGSATPETKPAEDEAAQHCQDLIQSVHGIFQLQELGVSSDMSQGISVLNQWQRACKGQTADTFDLPPALAELFGQALPAAAKGPIERAVFQQRDGEHLRNCLLYHAAGNAAGAGARDDLSRVVNVFLYVVRNLELVAEHTDAIPLTPYETYLYGRGTVEDRAWLFAEILRQLRIDSIAIRPGGEPENVAPVGGPLLVGVPVNGKVYLFDPRLGLPVPSAGEDLKQWPMDGVATVDEALQEPAIFARLAVEAGSPYSWTAESLKAARASLIGDVAFFAPRMQQLQSSFAGDAAMTIYDGLTEADGQPGLIERIRKLPGVPWAADSITLWEYPEQQLAGYEGLSALHKQTLERLREPLRAPISMEADQKAKAMRMVNQGIHGRARLAQAAGRYADAVKDYMPVQLQTGIPLFALNPQPVLQTIVAGVLKGKLPPEQWKPVLLTVREMQLVGGHFAEEPAALEKVLEQTTQSSFSDAAIAKCLEKLTDERFVTELRAADVPELRVRLTRLQEALDKTALPDDPKGGLKNLALQADVMLQQFARSAAANEQANEQAAVWMSICKLEQGSDNDRRIASDKLAAYLTAHPQGQWVATARYLLAVELARAGKLTKAAARLEEIPAEHPQHAGFAILARAWREE